MVSLAPFNSGFICDIIIHKVNIVLIMSAEGGGKIHRLYNINIINIRT